MVGEAVELMGDVFGKFEKVSGAIKN